MAERSGWTLETLKEYIDGQVASNDRRYEQRFKDSQTAVDAALNAAKEAVLKAEMASEKRFESTNEFREQMGDQQRTLYPRAEAELRFATLEARVTESNKLTETRIGELNKLIETRVAEFTKLVETRVGDLSKAVSAVSSKKEGGREVWAWALSGLMALLGVGSLIAVLTKK